MYRSLLQLNSSNYNYYLKILEAHGFKNLTVENKLSEEDQLKIKEILSKYEKNLPKASAH
jgi:hypothetical protein